MKKFDGFTLVEVVIAIAIISLACIPLISLLPAGINSIEKGKREVIDQILVQNIHSKLSGSEWKLTDDLNHFHRSIQSFDNEGESIKEGNLSAYSVQIFISQDGFLFQHFKNPYVKKFELRITNAPKTVIQRFTNPFYYRSYAFLVGRTDSQE